MRYVMAIIIRLLLVPIDVALLMLGLDIIEHYGFAVPTPGYWHCFGVWLGFYLVYVAIKPAESLRDVTA